jgi:methionyl aminopeptidase
MAQTTRKFPPLELMEDSATILKDAFHIVEGICYSGITTEEIDKSIHKFIVCSGASPAFLGYHGYPSSLCISVNEEVVHGVPSSRVLKDGDIVSIDCGVCFNGAITDACRTFIVGQASERQQNLLDKTQEALDNAIANAVEGNRIGDLSYAIQRTAELAGYNVPRELTGHAVGYKLHQPPWIPCHGRAGTGTIIREGMFLAIEPILIDGHWGIKQANGGWTVVTKTGALSAQVEDTIYISNNGPVILTRDE